MKQGVRTDERSALVVAAVVLATPLYAQQPYAPARYAAGSGPVLPALVVGGGQAFVELTIGPDGAVQKATPLRSTPPFTQGLIDAVSGWRFSPAIEDALGPDGKPQGPKPVASKVLVASLFRAPTLLTPTLGEKTVNIGRPRPRCSTHPRRTSRHSRHARLAGGVVLVEVSVDGAGAVKDARVIGSAPPFDQAGARCGAEMAIPAGAHQRTRDDRIRLSGLRLSQPITGR